jgi:O-antigen/teichoic acid export membrane protein
LIRKFYTSLGLLILLNVIIKPIWIFGIDRQVQNLVGMENYGTYFSLLGLSLVASFLLDWGFTTYYNRQLASEPQKFLRQAGNFLVIKAALLIIYLFVVFAIAYLSGLTQTAILFKLGLVQALISLFLFFRSIITSLQLFRTDAWLSVFDKTLMIILCGSMIYYPFAFIPVSIDNFLLIQLACLGVAVICAVLITIRNGVSYGINFEILPKRLLKESAPYALIVLLMSAHYRLDGFLLSEIHSNGKYEAGLYGAGYRILDATNMIGYLVASFLLPFIANNKTNQKVFSRTISITGFLLTAYAIVIASAVFLFGDRLYELLYNEGSGRGAFILMLCMPALLGYCLVHVYGTVLTAVGNIRQFCIIILACLLLNVFLNIILIPANGAIGTCIAAIITHILAGIITMIYVHYKYIYTLKNQHA